MHVHAVRARYVIAYVHDFVQVTIKFAAYTLLTLLVQMVIYLSIFHIRCKALGFGRASFTLRPSLMHMRGVL